MCELSIIVPVYKAEKYIERTVLALLTQEEVDYEILLIDDGSPDKSGLISDMLSEKYENVRCIHINNSGPGHARNVGIEEAKGEYVAFCDSDDIPANNMYGILLSVMKLYNTQLSLCDIYTERDKSNFGFPWKGNQYFEGIDCLSKLLASMLGNLSDNDSSTPVWGSSVRSIYVKEILLKNYIRFPEDIHFAEDLVFNVRYLIHCSSCFILDKVLYRYTLNEDSLMNSYKKYNPNMFEERKKLVNYILNEIEPLNMNELMVRFNTSIRCYFHECIGNAARSIMQYGYMYAFQEIKSITNDKDVHFVFSNTDVTYGNRKNIVYNLIKRKQNFILLLYYAFRFRYLL